jgi:uncharacterized membrane protein YqiK
MEILANSGALIELVKRLDGLQALFLLLVIVVFAAIGGVIYLMLRIVKATVKRTEIRTKQMAGFSNVQEEQSMQIKTIIGNFSEVFERLHKIENAVSRVEGRCEAIHGGGNAKK